MSDKIVSYLTYPPDKLLTTAEAAEYLGMSTGWLNNQRYLGRGPRYVKMGHVRYSFIDLVEFVKAHSRWNTSECKGPVGDATPQSSDERQQ